MRSVVDRNVVMRRKTVLAQSRRIAEYRKFLNSAWFHGRTIPGIAGSIPARGVDVVLL